MLHFERIAYDPVQWSSMLSSYTDRSVNQTPEWIAFLLATQGGEPVLAALYDDSNVVGHFVGVIGRRYGLKMLGSPLPGWATSYMGVNLKEGVSRREATASLARFAFKELGCAHLELCDRRLACDALEGLGFNRQLFPGFEIDLTGSEDELFARMTSACRRCIRKAAKSGVVIEEADDLKFADEYHAQLLDVFAKQSLVPTYDVGRVRALIEHVHGSGNLLLLRARDPEGNCIATGIFPALNERMIFWGGASWRKHQISRPNEAIQWYAIKYWKRRGIPYYDMGRGGEYKRKYGGRDIVVPSFRKSKYPGLDRARAIIQKTFKLRQRLSGRSKS